MITTKLIACKCTGTLAIKYQDSKYGGKRVHNQLQIVTKDAKPKWRCTCCAAINTD